MEKYTCGIVYQISLIQRGKVIQALIKELPKPRWSEKYGMVILPNNKENLNSIFSKFKGVAWVYPVGTNSYGVNCNFFFTNKPINQGKEVLTDNSYRKRTSKRGWRRVLPEIRK